MKVLVINAGSSSLKYQLLDMPAGEVVAKGLCERIGIDGKYKYEAKGQKLTGETPMANHSDAIRFLVSMLLDKENGVITDMKEIEAVGHRVVSGGEKLYESVLITAESKKAIEECIPLAPLHNPANLTGIEACEEVMPGVPQVAVFDTAFHAKMPKQAYVYAIPYEYYTKYGIRRYGFHGTSHRYVSEQCAKAMGKDIKDLRIITCHLGNGSSVSAVNGGVSVDTTMGLTPLEGLPMGTRSGNIDPAIVETICEREGLSVKEVLNILNKKSGVLGVSGVSSDFRDLCDAADQGNERAALAIDMFNYSVKKFIGAYAAAMGGVDAVVFTAGVGENDKAFRLQITEGLEFMGIKVDPVKNDIRGKFADISADGATVKTFVIPTNEELVIAMDTEAIVNK
ncbi:MAG: acetate kinase [Clostridia bacterium]|nr:acetate kinase [Clostridia bacterium]MBR4955869.1 acetate kinase [Clostridia bacterium]